MNMLSGAGAARLGGVWGSSSSVSSSFWSVWYASNSLLFTKTDSYTDTTSHYMIHNTEVIVVLPVMGVSSRSGCADISIATLPSWLDLCLTETGRLSDSRALTVNSVASKAGSTGMVWDEGSYSVCPLPPCSGQVQCSSCSHWGGSGMSTPGKAILKQVRKEDWTLYHTTWHGNHGG